jgi:hypothetical protein
MRTQAAILASVTILFLANSAGAAPAVYRAYCMAITNDMKPGDIPSQGEVLLAKGQKKNLLSYKGLDYVVRYADDAGREGVVTLSLLSDSGQKVVGETTSAVGSGSSFPDELTLKIGGVAAISCETISE